MFNICWIQGKSIVCMSKLHPVAKKDTPGSTWASLVAEPTVWKRDPEERLCQH